MLLFEPPQRHILLKLAGFIKAKYTSFGIQAAPRGAKVVMSSWSEAAFGRRIINPGNMQNANLVTLLPVRLQNSPSPHIL
jgi:hypothetical protein